MSGRPESPPESDVLLRDVRAVDLPVFFEHQLDPEAAHMADFPARDREWFMAHWNRILEGESVVRETILFEGEVAGNVVSFPASPVTASLPKVLERCGFRLSGEEPDGSIFELAANGGTAEGAGT